MENRSNYLATLNITLDVELTDMTPDKLQEVRYALEQFSIWLIENRFESNKYQLLERLESGIVGKDTELHVTSTCCDVEKIDEIYSNFKWPGIRNI